jgi:hypothetical protein
MPTRFITAVGVSSTGISHILGSLNEIAGPHAQGLRDLREHAYSGILTAGFKAREIRTANARAVGEFDLRPAAFVSAMTSYSGVSMRGRGSHGSPVAVAAESCIAKGEGRMP